MLTDSEDAVGHGVYDLYGGIDSFEVGQRDEGFARIAFSPPIPLILAMNGPSTGVSCHY